MLPLHTRVILKTFNGTATAPDSCPADENYWLLIGSTGRIAEERNRNGRVLVVFDEPVSPRGLPCHNPLANSLYILESNLNVHESEG